LLAYHQDAFGKTFDFGSELFHSLYDDCAGGSAIDLELSEAMDVWVVPVEAGRFGLRYLHAVLKARSAGLDEGVEHVVLMAGGCDIQTVEVDIGGA
jgi:hypothetical protein